jgi:anaerobic magnesium-protoporphyrin IX monomethyl ester cyclase
MVDRKWLMDLSEELISQKIGLRIFTSGGKPNLVSRELLKKMHQAGFVRISYGIESGSQRILDIMKKQTTVSQNYDAVKISIEEAIFTHLNMVLGMPGENISTLCETSDFLVGLSKAGLISTKNISFSYATGYPGTELYKYMLDKKIVDDTAEYLKVQSGVGEYKYKLCAVPISIMVLIKNVALLKIDFYYYLRKRQYKKACEVSLRWIAKILVELLIPFSIQKKIRVVLNRKRLGI